MKLHEHAEMNGKRHPMPGKKNLRDVASRLVDSD
jgi:hypothetical protein